MLRMRDAVFTACCLILILSPVDRAIAQGVADAPVTPEPAIEEEIRGRLGRYVEAFNSRDFDGLAKLIRSRFQFVDETSGDRIENKDAFIDRIKSAVESEPSLRLEARANRLELQEAATVLVSGSTALKAEGVPDELSRFTVTMTRAESGWQIASIIERTAGSTEVGASREAMQSLGWLVGTWQEVSSTEAEKAKVVSTVEFLPGKQFLRRTFVESPGDRLLGFEIIGYDPILNRVRSWLYFSDGSFGSGYWSGEKDHWSLKLTQTLPDGRIASGTYIIRPKDANTVNIKVIAREIDGEPMPLGSAITMSRVEVESRPDTDQPPSGETE